MLKKSRTPHVRGLVIGKWKVEECKSRVSFQFSQEKICCLLFMVSCAALCSGVYSLQSPATLSCDLYCLCVKFCCLFMSSIRFMSCIIICIRKSPGALLALYSVLVLSCWIKMYGYLNYSIFRWKTAL